MAYLPVTNFLSRVEKSPLSQDCVWVIYMLQCSPSVAKNLSKVDETSSSSSFFCFFSAASSLFLSSQFSESRFNGVFVNQVKIITIPLPKGIEFSLPGSLLRCSYLHLITTPSPPVSFVSRFGTFSKDGFKFLSFPRAKLCYSRN